MTFPRRFRDTALSCLTASAGLLLLSRAASADEITLGPSKDTTLYEDDATFGNGAGAYVFAGSNTDGLHRRALLAFDVAGALPLGTTVTDAKLLLYLSRARGPAEVSLHRVTADWGEGAAKAPGNEGAGIAAALQDATWSHRFWNTQSWAKAGGDFVSTTSASITDETMEAYNTFAGATLTADVKTFLETPAQNFGWIVMGEKTGADAAQRFGSKDGAHDSRPELVLTYTPPAAPVGACCAANGSCTIKLDPGSSCSGTYQGSATSCTPNPCPQPTGACCHLDKLATCTVETEASCTAAGAKWQEAQTTCTPNDCSVVLSPFVDALPLPPLATPVEGEAGTPTHYRISMVETKQQLHRDLPPTTVWGYDDGTAGALYPGPTIQAQAGSPIRVTWVNDLRDESGALRKTHVLPIEHCIHGADTNVPRTVVHLHGGHVPSAFDGQPESTLLPGAETTYDYPNNQDPATLWYHDHALGITRLNVMMGLAGFYLLRGDDEQKLALPSGKYEVPLVIQDRSFYPDGRLRYPATWQEHFFGDTVLVNGKVWPYLEVDRGKYRFRLLNGSNSRVYSLSLSDSSLFQQIGTDGGLLPHPLAMSKITLAPGERAELVVDFGKHQPGEGVQLVNDAPAPYPNGEAMHALPNVMEFRVTSSSGFHGDTPIDLRTIEPLDPKSAAQTRDFVLSREPDTCGGAMWMINGKHWDDITEQPHLGTTEVWRFINNSGETHPMHMHLAMFQVLDSQHFTMNGDTVVPSGDPSPPGPGNGGWKDTVQVGPSLMVRVIARFEDYAGRFPYHCHMLEHEDHDMMRQFEAVAVCGDGAVARGIEQCDDGNTTSGDGCSADCRLERDGGVDGGADASIDAASAAGGKRASAAPGGDKSSGCGCRIEASPQPVRAPASVASCAVVGLALIRRRRGFANSTHILHRA